MVSLVVNVWDLLAMLGIRSLFFSRGDRAPVVAVLCGLVTAFLAPAILWLTWNPGPVALAAVPVGYALGYVLVTTLYRSQIRQSRG